MFGSSTSLPNQSQDEAPEQNSTKSAALPVLTRQVVYPVRGEVITSTATSNSYTFGEKIGEGYFGMVFACTDVWRNDLAAKVFKPINSYEKVRSNATSELAKLRALRHPNVTFVHDAFEFRDTFYIITDRCQSSLADLLKQNWFKGHVWTNPVARCVLQAVHFLHTNGYVHQDIHPGNVLVSHSKDEMTPEERPAIGFKLGDLGVARIAGEVDASNTRADWMIPPEVLNVNEFGPIDRRIDIYHMGLLLLQLQLSKEIQFTREQILMGEPQSLALTLPPPFGNAIGKALRRHASLRTESAIALWHDLNRPGS